MDKKKSDQLSGRRDFIKITGLGAMAFGLQQAGCSGGGHGGSHGPLMNEFVSAIIQDRKPAVDVVMALNITVARIVAHTSALKDGELLKIPQYSM